MASTLHRHFGIFISVDVEVDVADVVVAVVVTGCDDVVVISDDLETIFNFPDIVNPPKDVDEEEVGVVVVGGVVVVVVAVLFPHLKNLHASAGNFEHL